MPNWYVFQGNQIQSQPESIAKLIEPPPWRRYPWYVSKTDRIPFNMAIPSQNCADYQRELKPEEDNRGRYYFAGGNEIKVINTALFLRRPILLTGKPGTGKSTLASAVAYELGLGQVLRWPVSSRTTLQDGLYRYDAVGRLGNLQERVLLNQRQGQNITQDDNIGRYIRLGPLGTALLPSYRPRVLLIDEVDKSDIDLPNELLSIFEEGWFEIPELGRLTEVDQIQVLPHDAKDYKDTVAVQNGRVHCQEFPLVIMTSNGERDFPPAFLRRCLQHTVQPPSKDELIKIVNTRLGDTELIKQANELIEVFYQKSLSETMATDQLLNAIYMSDQNVAVESDSVLISMLFRALE